MPRLRLTFTEYRRRKLAFRSPRLDQLESRSTVTPFTAFSIAAGAFQSFAQIGLAPAQVGLHPQGVARPEGPDSRTAAQRLADQSRTMAIADPGHTAQGGGWSQEPSGSALATRPAGRSTASAATPETALDLSPSSGAADSAPGIRTPWKPAARPGGGAVMTPRGGSGNGAQAAALAMVQGRNPLPAAPSTPAPPATIPGALTASPPSGPATALGAGLPTPPGSRPQVSPAAPVITRNTAAQSLNASSRAASSASMASHTSRTNTPPQFVENLSSLPYGATTGASESSSFPYFQL